MYVYLYNHINTSNVTYLTAYTCFPSYVHYIIRLQNIHERKSAARLTSLEINPILRAIIEQNINNLMNMHHSKYSLVRMISGR